MVGGGCTQINTKSQAHTKKTRDASANRVKLRFMLHTVAARTIFMTLSKQKQQKKKDTYRGEAVGSNGSAIIQM